MIDELMNDVSFLDNFYDEGMVSVFSDFEESSFSVNN